MKRFRLLGVGVALVPLASLAACDESTSGADHEADESLRPDAGETGSGGSGGKGGSSSSGGASGRGGGRGGTTGGTAMEAGRGGAGGNGGGTGGADVGGASGTTAAGTGAGMSPAGSGGQAGSRTLEEQIVRSADRDCQKLAACSPTLLAWNYGTLARCRAELEKLLSWNTSLPGSGISAAALERCVEDAIAGDCAAYISVVSTPSCRYQGALANGSACMTGQQCQTGFCRFANGLCGTCEPTPVEGSSCSTASDCPSMICTTGGTCATPSPRGATCSATRPCDSYLACSTTCQALPATAGAACGTSTSFPECDFKAGFHCSNETQGTCLAVTTVPEGGSCSGLADRCTPHGLCQEGTCVAGPDTGEVCSASQGRYCAPSEYCDSGLCSELPDPTTCDGA